MELLLPLKVTFGLVFSNQYSVLEQNGGFSENKMQKLSLQKSILSKT
jgi:hypothetical protein